MKASEIIKKPFPIESIYNNIENAVMNGEFKTFLPHFTFVDDETRLKLMKDGFKVYVGDWDGIMKNVLIIEW